MKLVIKQEGWENFTGQYGSVEFVDGVSVGDCPPRIACRISAAIRAEWANGVTPTLGNCFGADMEQSAPVEEPRSEDTTLPEQISTPTNEMTLVESDADRNARREAAETKPVADVGPHSEQSLAAVADQQGLAGLRAIGDAYKVQDKTIAGMISKILKAQAAAQAKAE